MMFSINDFFSKCDQIHRKLQIWSHLQKKPVMENFIFRAVLVIGYLKSNEKALSNGNIFLQAKSRQSWEWKL